MTKKIIIGVVAFFVIMAAVTYWIFSSFDQNNTEANSRTEADFTNAHFIVKELWEMQNKKNDQVLLSYLFIKVENEDINLRLPWEGSAEDEQALARKIKPGYAIDVKVLKSQLAAASQNGPLKAIGRFIMGDKREITIFKLTVNNHVLVDKDIHGVDEAKVNLLGRLISNPWLILIPGFIIIYIIGVVKRKNAAKPKA